MSNDGLVELKADAVTYYSAHDEHAFFDWLGKMVCIKNHYGKGTELYIVVDRAAVTGRTLGSDCILLQVQYVNGTVARV